MRYSNLWMKITHLFGCTVGNRVSGVGVMAESLSRSGFVRDWGEASDFHQACKSALVFSLDLAANPFAFK